MIIIAAIRVFPGDHGPNKTEMLVGDKIRTPEVLLL